MPNDVREDRTTADRSRLVSSVLHAFAVLDCLAAEEPLGPSELARRTGLGKSTVHSLLATLESLGAVRPDVNQGRFRLGLRLFELGTRVLEAQDPLHEAKGQLALLANETGETALLAVLDEKQVLYVDHADSPNAIRLVARRGRRAPLHATASGKVLLAFADPGLLDEVARGPLERFMPKTICDEATLVTAIGEVRQRQYAVVHEERDPGLSSISVPVRDHSGTVIAAMTVAGPSSRFDPPAIEAMREKLRDRAGASKTGS